MERKNSKDGPVGKLQARGVAYPQSSSSVRDTAAKTSKKDARDKEAINSKEFASKNFSGKTIEKLKEDFENSVCETATSRGPWPRQDTIVNDYSAHIQQFLRKLSFSSYRKGVVYNLLPSL